MPVVHDEVKWEEFLATPIARLEWYGLSTRVIGILERRYGIWVRNIQHLDAEALRIAGWIGPIGFERLTKSLSCLYEEVMNRGL